MNFNPRHIGSQVLPDPVDLLLADVAIRIQLSKTDHDKAVSRFGTMQDWVDRDGSPLQGMVLLMYPQGSMAIGSTVARVSDRDEYDIDVMVVLKIPRDSDPEDVLDALFQAIRGTPGSRYYDMTVRHTRCVCVTYEDGMHIDLTPSIWLAEETPRTSIIFHSKPEDPSVRKRRLLANPWGLADWFNTMTPRDTDFAEFYERRSLDHDLLKLESRAPAEPVPAREPAYRKSRALIALQLIKRWRNVLFVRPARSKLRRIPSVLLSKHVADNANQTQTLSEEVEHQARSLLVRLEAERSRRTLIRETNPRCDADVLTDRWPETAADQDLAISDLRDFVAKIHHLRTADLTLAEMSSVLEDLFGARPARRAVQDYLDRAPSGGSRIVPGSGRIIGGSFGLAGAPAVARPVPRHHFFGD